MSPRTRAEIADAPVHVRQLWAVDPAAARQYAADRRMFAATLADAAATAEDERVAAAMHLAADAAETELHRLADAMGEVTADLNAVFDLVGPPPEWSPR
ncbi:hypothetical protein ABT369_28265 [Dactylosporangium sp. NPDC000244]|uniref:hypothetical protein n=1 Tax=Dactylosporangium sp. NPDC000244 TaxID=3154365 RepID=UPI003326AB8E